jgi:hypothetical protein
LHYNRAQEAAVHVACALEDDGDLP